MNLIALEVRDVGTSIKIVAFKCNPDHPVIKSTGLRDRVVVVKLSSMDAEYDCHCWGNGTLCKAHDWLCRNWDHSDIMRLLIENDFVLDVSGIP